MNGLGSSLILVTFKPFRLYTVSFLIQTVNQQSVQLFFKPVRTFIPNQIKETWQLINRNMIRNITFDNK